jgi:hypothetical protein
VIALLEPPKKPDLARVIDVVECDPIKLRQEFCSALCA